MNEELEILSTIDDYLSGQLSGNALTSFESQMTNDAALAKKVKAQRLANELIFEENLNSLRDKIKTDLNTDNTTGFIIRTVLSISLGILFVGVLGYFGYSFFSQPLAKKELATSDKLKNQLPIVSENKVNTFAPSEISTAERQTISTNKTDKKESTVVINENVSSPFQLEKTETKATIETPSTQYQKNTSPEIVKETTKPNSCDGFALKLDWELEATCFQKKDGKISLSVLSSQNSEGPYKYSIDGGKKYQETSVFEKLSDGNYSIHVLDSRGCVFENTTKVKIKIKPCTEMQSYSFSASSGDNWRIPVKEDKSGKITIFDKQGKIVYSSSLSPSDQNEWDGRNNNGQYLPIGEYVYELVYEEKIEKERGYVSIVP